MAEFTKTAIRQSVMGDQQKITATITGASGSTYSTGLANLFFLDIAPGSAITGVTYSGGTATITTGGGAITAEKIALWGR